MRSGGRRRSEVIGTCVFAWILAVFPLPVSAEAPEADVFIPRPKLSIEAVGDDIEQLHCSFSPQQIALLEKLNRADRGNLISLGTIVVPEIWDLDEIAYSPLPLTYDAAQESPKALIVSQAGQAFGAYEYGALVHWGPISSGGPANPTPAGLFHLNWKSLGHRSTVNRNWFLPWNFNFHNERGHSFHQYELPGRADSHGCVRLLPRDARWLYSWGEAWKLGPRGWNIENLGTPVLIVGDANHGAPVLWRSPDYLRFGGWIPLRKSLLPVQTRLPGDGGEGESDSGDVSD